MNRKVTKSQTDKVNSPNHYTVGGIETIDFIRAKLTTEQFKGHCLANAIAYISRAEYKGDFKTDVKKAIKYLEWAID